MKTRVFVFVPYAVGLSRLLETADALLAIHQENRDDPEGRGRYDYLVGFEGGFRDTIAEGRLPDRVRRSLAGRVCEMEHFPIGVVPGAVVTPDGAWHALMDYGWRMVHELNPGHNERAWALWSARFEELRAAHPYCWVVETWSHS